MALPTMPAEMSAPADLSAPKRFATSPSLDVAPKLMAVDLNTLATLLKVRREEIPEEVLAAANRRLVLHAKLAPGALPIATLIEAVLEGESLIAREASAPKGKAKKKTDDEE